ncbi:MAG TPA: ribosomal protein S18-alanine N-acetyltransferase, partial [bacterium]|nr:ribosomal protein S18-alanine N-acetyltransferase [bacterium]
EDDLDRICDLERDLFGLPWSKTSFLFEVNDSRTSCPITALEDGQVVGYAVGWFVADELHIGNVAVARARQGTGIGKILVEYLLKEAAERSVSYATLEVRVSNVRAMNLYRKYGFKGIAIRKCYYADTGEDAMVMMAEIGRTSPREAGLQAGDRDHGDGAQRGREDSQARKPEV